MSVHFHPLKVAEIVPETAEANSIRFEIPAELRDAFTFRAGQHLTLRAGIDHELFASYLAAWNERDAYAVSHVGWGLNHHCRWDVLPLYDKGDVNGTELRAFAGNFLYSAGANEVAKAWQFAMNKKDAPTVLALSRQGLPIWDPKGVPADAVTRGGYVLRNKSGKPDVILIGTGSEVHVCNDAIDLLGEQGVNARLVSMPCVENFVEQDEDYRNDVLPPDVRMQLWPFLEGAPDALPAPPEGPPLEHQIAAVAPVALPSLPSLRKQRSRDEIVDALRSAYPSVLEKLRQRRNTG